MAGCVMRVAPVAVLSFVLAGGTAAMAQGLPPLERIFSDGSAVQIYGQINMGVLRYDDGIDSETYAPIDNDNSGTRIGLLYTQPFGAWTFQNRNEFGYTPYSTGNINIEDNSPSWGLNRSNIRWIDFTMAHERHGKFWIGQGSMATDGTLDVDLSGTNVIASSSVADSASAQIIRFSDPALADDFSGPQIGDVFDNLNGVRRVRLRYDTPTVANFTLAAAFGRNLLSSNSDVRDENLVDASLNYARTYDAYQVQASVGYNWREGVAGADAVSIWGGSGSVLHRPTGLNLSLSAATADATGDPSYWYGKLGLLRRLVAWGDTAMSVDYYSGSDFGLGGDVTRSSSESWGLALVQNIDRANTQLWLTWRSYEYSDDVASYEDATAIFAGARFRF
jgi:hypothetical protein